MTTRRSAALIAMVFGVCGMVALLALGSGARADAQSPPAHADDGAAAAAFEAIVPVLRHPRCMNCHSNGDYPRQGDDGHPPYYAGAPRTQRFRRQCGRVQHLPPGPQPCGLAYSAGGAQLAHAASRQANDLGRIIRPAALRTVQGSEAERGPRSPGDSRAYEYATGVVGLASWTGPYPSASVASPIPGKSAGVGR